MATDPTLPAASEADTEARLSALEQTLAELRQEIAALRYERAAMGRDAAAAPSPSAAAPHGDAAHDDDPLRAAFRSELTRFDRRSRERPHDEGAEPRASGRRTVNVDTATIEGFVGRFGTLLLATITALAAVGTFLSWAIAHGLLGPRVRVALGLATAVAIGIAGFRLRRSERSFGSSLVGLALAIVHVCAWAAGPSLGIVPSAVAFFLAASVSVALAVFAQAEADEPLWCVGFVGAAAAPFVVSSGQGSASLLAAYALVVLIGSAYALGSRTWRVAGQLFVLAATVFTGALMTLPERELGPLFALGLPLLAAVGGVLPFTEGATLRPRTRALGALAALAALRLGFTTVIPLRPIALVSILAAAGIAWLALADRLADCEPGESARLSSLDRPETSAWVEGALLPLAYLAAIVAMLDGAWRPSAMAGLAAAVVLLAFTLRHDRAARDAGAFATAVALAVFAVCITESDPIPLAYALAGVGVLLASADLVLPTSSWRWTSVLVLGVASLDVLAQLEMRVPYAYTPFFTAQSFAAMAVLAGWGATIALSRTGDARLRRAGWIGGSVMAFLWAHTELAHAFNATTATVLRISYYAATSMLAVGIGRAKRIAVVRHVGLLLALVAAGTALQQVRWLSSVGARIAAYLVVSAFLMGIAYWYRAGLPEPAATGSSD